MVSLLVLPELAIDILPLRNESTIMLKLYLLEKPFSSVKLTLTGYTPSVVFNIGVTSKTPFEYEVKEEAIPRVILQLTLT